MSDTATVHQKSAEVFAAATGRGVRVAVIDSGVNPHHPHVQGVAGGIAIGLKLGINSYTDYLGHGTAVLSAIKEKAPDALYFAVKIYYRSLKTDVDFLVRAMQWALDEKMDVINLSVGTTNESHRPRLTPLVERAARQGAVIVAAAQVDLTPALPGIIPGVIGVGLDWTCRRDNFKVMSSPNGPYCTASGYPRTLPGVSPSRNLYGVSFSVANISGFVARACEISSDRSVRAIAEVLGRESARINAVSEPPHTR